jgi:hypothetical protein
MQYERVEVKCYSGYEANERPIALTFKRIKMDIQGIMDRWYEGSMDSSRFETSYFKARTTEGQILSSVISYDSMPGRFWCERDSSLGKEKGITQNFRKDQVGIFIVGNQGGGDEEIGNQQSVHADGIRSGCPDHNE